MEGPHRDTQIKNPFVGLILGVYMTVKCIKPNVLREKCLKLYSLSSIQSLWMKKSRSADCVFSTFPSTLWQQAPTVIWWLDYWPGYSSVLMTACRPRRRILDDDRLQRLLQPSEMVVKKLFRWLHLKKTSKIVVNDGWKLKKHCKTSENDGWNNVLVNSNNWYFWPFWAFLILLTK